MQTKHKTYTLGVAIARFQVPKLHEAHIELITQLLDQHPKVLILLGLSMVRATTYNPLEWVPRKQMILEVFPQDKYPNLHVGYIKDTPSDEVWSNKVDELIQDCLGPQDTAILYGGRDSFLPHYKGRFDTEELTSSRHVSGTEIRALVAQAPQSHPMFRMGAVWAAFQRYPTAYSTVDVLVHDASHNRVLLARKTHEADYRLVGGFASPGDESFEHAALRELDEETGLTVGLKGLHYVGSQRIDDWRYRAGQDKIITHLYVGRYTHGAATAKDDIAEVRWFDFGKPEYVATLLVAEHRTLFARAAEWIQANTPKAI